MKKTFKLAALVFAVVTVGATASSAAASRADNLPRPDDAPGWFQGQEALTRIGARLPEVASANGLTGAQLSSALLDDPTLAVDSDLNLAYFDVLAPGEEAAGETVEPVLASAPPVGGAEFQLESLPGATKTVYLDFDGHTTTGTQWNNAYGVDTIVSPAYDRDGDPNSWNSTELKIIRDTWAVVSEDFAPWDINVTTKDPGADALMKSGDGDSTWGIRVVLTKDTFAKCGCGGHAYIGSFNSSKDMPTFVYNSGFVSMSEAATHEVGHSLYLSHDGTTSGNTYYRGHGSGDTSWAPIMGSAYYVSVSHWSDQTYFGANNTGSSANYGRGVDDTSLIATMNGFSVRADDHGNSMLDATPLEGNTPSVSGLIATRNDVDVFSFSTAGGTATFNADPASIAANLDIELRLRDNTGSLVAVGTDPSTLSASLTVNLVAGDYTIEVDGVGTGDETNNPPTGYSDYGSLGVYTLSGSFDSTTPQPPPPPPPSGDTSASGESTTAGTVSGDYTATFAADGNSQQVTESQSGGKPRDRHDTMDHRWAFASPGAVQTLSIVAEVTDGGDRDEGIELQWSSDGSSWVSLATLTGSVNDSYLLGSPSGTIWVRVVDTDSTGRELSFDSVAVDMLQISSEEVSDPTTVMISSMSTSTVGAGRGSHSAQASVVVVNELGQPVNGAVVSYAFSGDFGDTGTVVTNTAGVATFTTSTAVKKPSFQVCVTDVTAAGLTYSGTFVCQDK